jgi:hypothetical protein
MILKEFAFSVTNRHHFYPPSKISSFNNISSDTFMSLWDYDETVTEYVKKKKTLSGYRGDLYMPDEFIFDIDGSNLDQAKELTFGLLDILDNLGISIPVQIYFSGEKGFHIHISHTAFKWKPCNDLHLKVKHVLTNSGIYDYADPLVIDRTRLIRIPNTLKIQSGYWKVPIKRSEISEVNEQWLDINASKPRDKFQYEDLETNAVFDVTVSLPKAKFVSQGRNSSSNNYICIQKIMENVPYGFRHKAALTLGSHLRSRFPEDSVRVLMEHWRTKISSMDHPFKEKEMDQIINSVYNANDGEGYNFGCNSEVKDRMCSPECKLYKSKKSISSFNINDLEKELIQFYSNDQDPLNIGNMYDQDFPIHPGETMLITAPPESMKSMLILNWLLAFNRRSYFMEFEMSRRQIMERVSMIHNGWDQKSLIEHYKTGKNGMPKMSHIEFEFEPCFPWEIKKKLDVIDFKPEVIFIDHCGLMKSRFRDEMSKDKDISEGIMNLAKDLNCIVIGIWELSKDAFKNGVDISSPSGSFRISYNANKIVALNPVRNGQGSIQHIELVTIKNREQERLNCRLDVDQRRNGRII